MAAKLIGLSGMAGAGKDFAFTTIHNKYHHQKTVKRIALADGVRQEIEDIVGAGAEELPAVWKKPYPPEIRWLLQQWGTELRRAQDKDYWVKFAFKEIEKYEVMCEELNAKFKATLLFVPDVWVFTDVRFANEAQGIRDQGGIIVEVTAPQAVRARRLGGVLPPNHASEDIDFAPDAIIVNDRDDRAPAITASIKEYLG